MNTKKLKGPIMIFGAGGFIGFNLFLTLLKDRNDVIGVSHDPEGNWRFKTGLIPSHSIKKCDMNDTKQLSTVLKRIKPRTLFNLAAYGAYPHQKDQAAIYRTNFTATVDSIEIAKQVGFDAYVYAGTSSEYGLNCVQPKEWDELVPNSHYAVSKAAVSHLLTYYGLIENLPVTHLRLYSAYGPWEEPKRLIPQLVLHGEKGRFPPLVNPSISRDYVFVDDIVHAFILSALNITKMKGSIYNVATNKKTTIRQLVQIIKPIANIQKEPDFSTMPNRLWDLVNWYGDSNKFIKTTHWHPVYSLEKGLKKTINWHLKQQVWRL